MSCANIHRVHRKCCPRKLRGHSARFYAAAHWKFYAYNCVFQMKLVSLTKLPSLVSQKWTAWTTRSKKSLRLMRRRPVPLLHLAHAAPNPVFQRFIKLQQLERRLRHRLHPLVAVERRGSTPRPSRARFFALRRATAGTMHPGCFIVCRWYCKRMEAVSNQRDFRKKFDTALPEQMYRKRKVCACRRFTAHRVAAKSV